LLIDRLHRHGLDLVVAIGFQKGLGVSAVRFVPPYVAMHIVRRQ
jgi:hypothetical protein